MVELFGRPTCSPCKVARRILTDAGVEFTYHDIDADSAAMEQVVAMGFQSVPVVRATGLKPFSGIQGLREVIDHQIAA